MIILDKYKIKYIQETLNLIPFNFFLKKSLQIKALSEYVKNYLYSN